MRHLYLTILISIFSWAVNAESVIGLQRNYPVDTSSILKEMTQSLICTVLLDSAFLRENYVVNQYYSPVSWANGTRANENKWYKRNRASHVKNDTVLYDPFNIDGYGFDFKRSIDTNKLKISCLPQTKTVIDTSQLHGKFVLSIKEPPVFSKDYTEALIIVVVNCDGGGSGDQLFYVFENKRWKKVSTKSIWRS
jgi:hypothetical protein